MITFVTGKPGAGKGLMAMKLIVDELVNTKRNVITNLAVRILPWINGRGEAMIGLQQFLLKTYGKDFDCLARVWFLHDDQAAEFFLWRVSKTAADGFRLERAKPEILSRGDNEKVMGFDTDLATQNGSCFYVIDEAWKFWGSRNWQRTGEGVLFYNAQHRKFGDDVLIVTQHTKQIDPAVQRVAQDFWVVRNHGMLSMGIFRQPDAFTVAIYEHPPVGSSQEPMSRKVFTLDRKGIAQTYDTSAGVGLSGKMVADTMRRKKGIPWWGALIFALLLLFLLAKSPTYLGRITSWFIHRSKPVARRTVAAYRGAVGVTNGGKQFGVLVPPQNSPVLERTAVRTNLPMPVTCTGYVVINSTNALVFLSDGRNAELRFDEIQKITRTNVVVFGQSFPIDPAPRLEFSEPEGNQSVQLPQDVSSFSYVQPENSVSVSTIGQNYRSALSSSHTFNAASSLNYNSSFGRSVP
jgi:Zonular occludens toxin (Zot)